MRVTESITIGQVPSIAAAAALLTCGLAGDGQARTPKVCSATARVQSAACRAEVQDDFLTQKAICLNLPDKAASKACQKDAAGEAKETKMLCKEQLGARRDLCDALGEEPYAPGLDPTDFDADFANLTTPNPYFPIVAGNHWEYVAPDENVAVTVLDETKLIDGLTCIVVNDLVTIDGFPLEDTDDWYAHAKNGDLYYCGEEVKDYEVFEGDDPQVAELVSIDGSFKAGRDGDKAGISIPGSPAVGQVYRQEYSVGNAEDAAEVLSTTYDYGVVPDLDTGVPAALAELLCNGDCLVTREFTPIEPDAVARKYYAPNVGLFLEVPLEDPENILQLVACNVDPRCGSLPGAP